MRGNIGWLWSAVQPEQAEIAAKNRKPPKPHYSENRDKECIPAERLGFLQGFHGFTQQVKTEGYDGVEKQQHAADNRDPLDCTGYGCAAEQQNARDDR